MTEQFDQLSAIDQNPFIPKTISAVVFEMLRNGETLTTSAIGKGVHANLRGGDKDYLFGILRRDLEWLYEIADESGKKSRKKITLTTRTRIRMRQMRDIRQSRWDAQLRNTRRWMTSE